MKLCDYYRQKISEHSPPETENDKRMIRIYEWFLTRDHSLLHNLNLLQQNEVMCKDSRSDVTSVSPDLSESSAPLDMDEFRALLDEKPENNMRRWVFR
jgi:hypothetical protein